MFVVNNRKIFFGISGVLVALSLIAIIVWGLPLGIDFTGGSVLEVSFEARPELVEVESVINELEIDGASVRPTRLRAASDGQAGRDGYLIRTRFLEDSERAALVGALEGLPAATDTAQAGNVERFSSVGPTIGEELRRKALYAILFVVALIIFYIAFAFRKVSEPVSSWKYGVAAIVALIHDILIPAGVIAVLGQFGNATADTLFVMALLAILGLSVNDTIVVFDRIRENLSINKEKNKGEKFEQTVGRGLSQTYTRSINTSLTTLLVLLALFFIGGATVHTFVLTLIVGVIAGTYSSIFLASPLLVFMESGSKKKKR